MSDIVTELEEASRAALEDYHAYRTYQGSNSEYFRKARLGVGVMSVYARVRGTRANERALDLMAHRMMGGGASGGVVTEGPGVLALDNSQPVLQIPLTDAEDAATGEPETGTARKTGGKRAKA